MALLNSDDILNLQGGRSYSNKKFWKSHFWRYEAHLIFDDTVMLLYMIGDQNRTENFYSGKTSPIEQGIQVDFVPKPIQEV